MNMKIIYQYLELTVVIWPFFFLGPESNSWPGAWPDNTSEYWGRHDRTEEKSWRTKARGSYLRYIQSV